MNDNLLDELLKKISKLPSFGPKSAKRLLLHLLANKEQVMEPLIDLLINAKNELHKCSICGNFTSNENICNICGDRTRNENIICVVENVDDLWAIEGTGIYRGLYHILGGNLSASDGKTPNDLNLKTLINRMKDTRISEVIIATNPTIEGQTTAFYVHDLLKEFNIKITQPALGIPLGTEFNYIDDGTLDIAFKNKREF
jgi:recombination protein RecR